MNKTFSIDRLSVGQINKLIRSIERYEDSFNRKTSRLIEELTLDGAEEAQRAYRSMAMVSATTEENTGHIIASGEAVIIAEFGAGDATNENHPFSNEPVEITPGSYSRSELGTGEYDETGEWHWNRQRFTEIQPRKGLEEACTTVQQNLLQRASEVFK